MSVNLSDMSPESQAFLRSLMRGPQAVVVGSSGDYTDIQSAIDAISDAAVDKRYTVFVQPGGYAAFTMKEYVDVFLGSRSTVIETVYDSSVLIAPYTSLFGGRVIFDDNSGGGSYTQAAIEKPAEIIEDFHLVGTEIEVMSCAGAPGDRYAIAMHSNTVELFLENVLILSRCGGIHLDSAGNITANGSSIFLIGEDTPASAGVNHYGLRHDTGGRIRWFGGHITCGYNQMPTPNPSEATNDICCAYIPATNTNSSCRIDLHGVWIYARNEHEIAPISGATPTGLLHTTYAANGWIRRHGCSEQAENPPTYDAKAAYGAFNTADQPGTGIGGKNQKFGGRATGSDGNVGGQLITLDGVDPASPELDGQDDGFVYLDASNGAFTVALSTAQASIDRELLFYHGAGTANVTLDAQGSNVVQPEGGTTITVRPRELVGLRKTADDTWIETIPRPFVRQVGSSTDTAMTGSDVEIWSYSIPAGLIGIHGAIKIDAIIDARSAGGTVTAKMKMNGNSMLTVGVTAGEINVRKWLFANQGAANDQLGMTVVKDGLGESSGGTHVKDGTINTASAVTLSFSLNAASGTCCLAWFRMEILPGY